MSNTPQPIQFLLHQLATNEGNRERFNQVIPENILQILFVEIDSEHNYFVSFEYQSFPEKYNSSYDSLPEIYQEKIIRTCLSRITNVLSPAVLNVFSDLFVTSGCYEAFDCPLRNGKPLNQAIQALHDKMLELVPQYREFLNNEK